MSTTLKATSLAVLALLALSSFALVPRVQAEEGPSSRSGKNTMEMRLKNASTTPDEWKKRFEMRKQEIEMRMDAREMKLDQKKEELKNRFDARVAKLETNTKQRILRFVGKTEERFLAAIERLHKIADRIQSRADKLKSQGVDTASSTEAIAKARVDLDDAEKLTLDLSTQADSILNASSTASSTPQMAFEQVRGAIAAVKEKIKSAHRHLTEAVIPLKASGKDKSGKGTDTGTTTDIE